MCRDCERIDRFYNRTGKTKEELEQDDIEARWHRKGNP